MSRVIVIGAGVVGLTCAVRLAEAGHDVAVLARDLPGETTSSVAAALWYPYRADPPERVLGWAAASYRTFEEIARTAPESGVRMRWGTELLPTAAADPWWAPAVPRLERVSAPPSPYADGLRFPAPVADMSVYLPWLAARFADLGGTLTRQALTALPNRTRLVVNCSGLGARHLASDRTVQPVRGQICLLEQTGLNEWWLADKVPGGDQGRDPGGGSGGDAGSRGGAGEAGPAEPGDGDAPCYVVPRLHDIVVGGTAEEGSWDRRPDPATATRLLERAERLVPAIAGARVLAHRTGLRPARPAVRLEAEERDGTTVVHCYGHGGSGMTVSWGCADEVVTLADRALST